MFVRCSYLVPTHDGAPGLPSDRDTGVAARGFSAELQLRAQAQAPVLYLLSYLSIIQIKSMKVFRVRR